jgi:hypothetical protein
MRRRGRLHAQRTKPTLALITVAATAAAMDGRIVGRPLQRSSIQPDNIDKSTPVRMLHTSWSKCDAADEPSFRLVVA